MHSVLGKGLVAMALGTALFAGGCTTNEEYHRLQVSVDASKMQADEAIAAARAAQARADQAAAAASAAQAAARDAAANADKARQEAEGASQSSTRLARGERG
jgi:ribosomal protein L12E/L44/L45/RPP1/RPP2